MVYLPWIAMMAISISEHAYGSAEDTLSAAHGWTQSNTFWILSVWVFFQAGIAFPAGWLRKKGILTARRAMYLGSAMCLLGFLALSHLDNVLLAILGFGVVGGVGSGLVYATCINMVGKWFPERRGAKTGFVNGGLAYGSLPFIFIFNYAFDTGNYDEVLDLIGVYVLIVVAVCAWFFKDRDARQLPTHTTGVPLRARLKNLYGTAKEASGGHGRAVHPGTDVSVRPVTRRELLAVGKALRWAMTDAEGEAEALADVLGVAETLVPSAATCSASPVLLLSLPQPETSRSTPPTAVTVMSLRVRAGRFDSEWCPVSRKRGEAGSSGRSIKEPFN